MTFTNISEKYDPREPRYWAFRARPDRYKVLEAVHGLETGYWYVNRSDVRQGDFAVIWQCLDDRRKRGIVAFAEILSNPEIRGNLEDPYWVKQDELQEKRRRVEVKYYVSPQLPLWIDGSETGTFLGSLSVARATGGTVFHISAAQWEKLQDLCGFSRTSFLSRDMAWPDSTSLNEK